jgi:hypothetical protein
MIFTLLRYKLGKLKKEEELIIDGENLVTVKDLLEVFKGNNNQMIIFLEEAIKKYITDELKKDRIGYRN